MDGTLFETIFPLRNSISLFRVFKKWREEKIRRVYASLNKLALSNIRNNRQEATTWPVLIN